MFCLSVSDAGVPINLLLIVCYGYLRILGSILNDYESSFPVTMKATNSDPPPT